MAPRWPRSHSLRGRRTSRSRSLSTRCNPQSWCHSQAGACAAARVIRTQQVGGRSRPLLSPAREVRPLRESVRLRGLKWRSLSQDRVSDCAGSGGRPSSASTQVRGDRSTRNSGRRDRSWLRPPTANRVPAQRPAYPNNFRWMPHTGRHDPLDSGGTVPGRSFGRPRLCQPLPCSPTNSLSAVAGSKPVGTS
jgi:hypothetical protein